METVDAMANAWIARKTMIIAKFGEKLRTMFASV